MYRDSSADRAESSLHVRIPPKPDVESYPFGVFNRAEPNFQTQTPASQILAEPEELPSALSVCGLARAVCRVTTTAVD
jgi:hypothetical protein